MAGIVKGLYLVAIANRLKPREANSYNSTKGKLGLSAKNVSRPQTAAAQGVWMLNSNVSIKNLIAVDP